MKKLNIYFLILLVNFLFSFFSCNYYQVCEISETQSCNCPDGTKSTQTCSEEGAVWNTCECTTYGTWCDPNSGLCWQNPHKDAYEEGNGGVTSIDAKRYCEELVLGGYDDWRLPNIEELRSIIQGNIFATTWGQCYIREGSSMNDQPLPNHIPCLGGINPLSGPDESGCFWKTELSGNCNTPDPASSTHYLETWSTTKAADDPENWIAYIFFDTATVGFNHTLSLGDVRCARDAPTPQVGCTNEPDLICEPGATEQCTCDNGKVGAKVCSDGGKCYNPCDCTGFTPSPKPADVCGQCDQIKVKINVLNELTKQPYMLAAFLYKEGELFLRPPDVGNDENEIRYPDINKGKSIEMTIPGCSYYRDRCMSGEYYLVVYLKMNEGKFPGMPEMVDYVWVNFRPITLTGDGTKYYEYDVTVVPIFLSPLVMLFDNQ